MIRIPTPVKLCVEEMPGRTWEFEPPLDWELSTHSNQILKFYKLPNGCRVGVSAFAHDGHIWIHASISRRDRVPSYDDLCMLKNVVFGPNRICAQVFECEKNHVNIHPFCLHLWGPNMESVWPLPRFTEGTI